MHFRTISEVAAGRIARFTPTRLCCSRILSIQNPFSILYVGKNRDTSTFMSGLSSRPLHSAVWTFLPDKIRVAVAFQRASYIIDFLFFLVNSFSIDWILNLLVE